MLSTKRRRNENIIQKKYIIRENRLLADTNCYIKTDSLTHHKQKYNKQKKSMLKNCSIQNDC